MIRNGEKGGSVFKLLIVRSCDVLWLVIGADADARKIQFEFESLIDVHRVDPLV